MPKITVRLEEQPKIICPTCKASRFIPSVELYYLNSFISPTKQAHIQEHPGTLQYVCLFCQKLLPSIKKIKELNSFETQENDDVSN